MRLRCSWRSDTRIEKTLLRKIRPEHRPHLCQIMFLRGHPSQLCEQRGIGARRKAQPIALLRRSSENSLGDFAHTRERGWIVLQLGEIALRKGVVWRWCQSLNAIGAVRSEIGRWCKAWFYDPRPDANQAQFGVGTQNGPRYTLRFCRAFDGAHLAKRSERGGWRIGIGPEVIAGEIDMLPTER